MHEAHTVFWTVFTWSGGIIRNYIFVSFSVRREYQHGLDVYEVWRRNGKRNKQGGLEKFLSPRMYENFLSIGIYEKSLSIGKFSKKMKNDEILK